MPLQTAVAQEKIRVIKTLYAMRKVKEDPSAELQYLDDFVLIASPMMAKCHGSCSNKKKANADRCANRVDYGSMMCCHHHRGDKVAQDWDAMMKYASSVHTAKMAEVAEANLINGMFEDENMEVGLFN